MGTSGLARARVGRRDAGQRDWRRSGGRQCTRVRRYATARWEGRCRVRSEKKKDGSRRERQVDTAWQRSACSVLCCGRKARGARYVDPAFISCFNVLGTGGQQQHGQIAMATCLASRMMATEQQVRVDLMLESPRGSQAAWAYLSPGPSPIASSRAGVPLVQPRHVYRLVNSQPAFAVTPARFAWASILLHFIVSCPPAHPGRAAQPPRPLCTSAPCEQSTGFEKKTHGSRARPACAREPVTPCCASTRRA